MTRPRDNEEEPGPFTPLYEEWIPCVRCGKRNPYEICGKCLDEMDAFAVDALKAFATEEEIDEWCWQHDIKRRDKE